MWGVPVPPPQPAVLTLTLCQPAAPRGRSSGVLLVVLAISRHRGATGGPGCGVSPRSAAVSTAKDPSRLLGTLSSELKPCSRVTL